MGSVRNIFNVSDQKVRSPYVKCGLSVAWGVVSSKQGIYSKARDHLNSWQDKCDIWNYLEETVSFFEGKKTVFLVCLVFKGRAELQSILATPGAPLWTGQRFANSSRHYIHCRSSLQPKTILEQFLATISHAFILATWLFQHPSKLVAHSLACPLLISAFYQPFHSAFIRAMAITL